MATRNDELISQLAEIVGSTHVSGVDADLKIYGDLDPELVVWPASAREVAQVLRLCAGAGSRVGVIGGRTRARRWSAPARIALNTLRMSDILDIDERSLIVHAQAGLRLRHLEDALRRQGLTLGYFRAGRQQGSTLGGVLAAPLAVTHSPLYGRLVDNCVAISVARLDGKVLHTPVVPRSATGPDVKRLYLGAGGQLGVITAAVLRAHRLPEAELPLVQLYADLEQALAAARRILARGVRPARLLLVNEPQAKAEVGERGYPMPALCVALLAGPRALVEAQARVLAEVVHDLDGSELPQKLADRWWQAQLSQDAAIDDEEAVVVDDGCRGFRLRHSTARATLAALARSLERGGRSLDSVPVWIDNLSLHGGVLWVGDEPGDDPELVSQALESVAAPLIGRVRDALDHDGVLVGPLADRGPLLLAEPTSEGQTRPDGAPRPDGGVQ